MTVYDNDREPASNTDHELRRRPVGGSYAQASYSPGLIWIPVAAIFLLLVLILGVGFAYGDYSGQTRSFDNGTLLEQQRGQVSQPGIPTPASGAPPPEIGASGTGEEPSSLPEAAPPLANDGQ